MFSALNRPESSAQVEFALTRPSSPSIAGSYTSINNLGRTIREGRKKVGDDVFEETVVIFVEKSFERLKNKRVTDYRLWETIHHDFEMFDETTWKILKGPQWELIREVCYTQGFWLDHVGHKGSRQGIMHKAARGDYYSKWTADQIKWAEDQGYSLSPAVTKRKAELLQGLSGPASSNVAADHRPVASSPNQPISSISQQQQPQIAQNSENRPREDTNTASQQPQNARQQLNIQHQPLPHWLGGNTRNSNLSPSGQAMFAGLPPSGQQIINIPTRPQQDYRGHILSNVQSTILPQSQSTSQTHPSRARFGARDIRLEEDLDSPFQDDWNPRQARYERGPNDPPDPPQTEPGWRPRNEEYQARRQEFQPTHQTVQPETIPPADIQSLTPPGQQPINQPQVQPLGPSQLPPSHPSHGHQEFQAQNQPSDTRTQHSHELTQLDKIYKDEDKFSGTGDNFNFKLNIFTDKCNRVGLPMEAWSKAASIMLSGQAQTFYYANRSTIATWSDFELSMRKFFEGPEWHRMNLIKWQTVSLSDTISSNPTLSTAECLRKLITEMDILQRGIDPQFGGQFHLRENIIRAVRGHPALLVGLTNPADDVASLVSNLQSSIINYEAVHRPPTHGTYVQSYKNDEEGGNEAENEAYYTDRSYRGGRSGMRGRGRFFRPRNMGQRGSFRSGPPRQKKCFVCEKVGCWSTNHTPQERADSIKKFGDKYPHLRARPSFNKDVQHWITEYEGEDADETTQFFNQLTIDSETYNTESDWPENVESNDQYYISYGLFENSESLIIIGQFANNSLLHRVSKCDETTSPPPPTPYIYNAISESRYGSTEFKGILIDTGASARSSAGLAQYEALKRLDDSIKLDHSTAGSASFTFGIGSTPSVGSINLNTPMGSVMFHIVAANTPFLLSLADLDKLGAFFNNITNQLIQSERTFPVIRRYGHAFLLWHMSAFNLVADSLMNNPCFLTEPELRQLHRRFGHPSVRRLQAILDRAGHDIDPHVLRELTDYCDQCQRHGRSPGRFAFTLKDDVDFNFNLIVDIVYLNSKPVLHVVDEATRFQAGRWLKDISAKHVWEQIRSCWIDTYLGPPDFISTDAGKQFVAREFKQYAINMGITVKTVPVEAHHSIGQVERYHGPLRRIYTIITTEIPGIDPELGLQMAFKAINDSVGPNGLIPTLLVFGAYPRMTEMDAPSPTVTQRATAMKKAMDEVRKHTASRQVRDALNIRNGPSTISVRGLPLNSEVLVFREGIGGQTGAWRGPYKLLGLENEAAILELPRGPTRFRITSIKPYHRSDDAEETEHSPSSADEEGSEDPVDQISPDPIDQNDLDATESPNASSIEPPAVQPTKRGRGRPRKFLTQVNLTTTGPDICFLMNDFDFMFDDFSDDLRDHSDHFLTEISPQFAASRQKEINGLLEKGVFKLVSASEVPSGIRIFNARFVDEIKNEGTEKAFEKSRLVVQAYNDFNKDQVLTQSPTIQRVSQRLVVCMAAVLGVNPNDPSNSMKLFLRDVTQAYVQSTSNLNREFYVRPPHELASEMRASYDCILKVMRPLYGVPEAGNHWFSTYHKHHIEKLAMTESTYDPCLLHCTEPFGLVGLQTDDTLILASDDFAIKEDEAIKAAKFMTKERECLSTTNSIKFNGMRIELQKDGSITIKHASYVGGISIIKNQNSSSTSARGITREKLTPKDQYVAQRARGAYVASICQPEASFDLSYAAQAINITLDDIASLNKRLTWQIENKSRGLKYVKLDLDSLRLVVFTDSSYANNRDLTSQIGYVICLADASDRANILHWSSIKCRRVTRSVLASELYGLAHGFDLGAVLKATVGRILRSNISLVVCTDSRSLYQCLVRLGTTEEKRLMIDVMSLRQSYERREITEIRWIDGNSNPADAMTKEKATSALKTLIDTNRINLTATEWVERSGGGQGALNMGIKTERLENEKE